MTQKELERWIAKWAVKLVLVALVLYLLISGLHTHG